MEFRCSSCGVKLLLPVGHSGNTYQCPFCRAQSAIPEAPKLTPDASTSDARRASDARNAGIERKAKALSALRLAVYAGIAVVVVLIGLAVFSIVVRQLQASAGRAVAINHMKQIGLALHNFYGTHLKLPRPNVLGPDGGDGALSWRVTILPYIEEALLYRRFDKDSNWNSPANEPWLNEMPAIYADPMRPKHPINATHFQLFTGPGTAFAGAEPPKLDRDISPNNFLFAEAADPVPWTKPADMACEPDRPLPLPEGTFLVCTADITVRPIDRVRVTDDALRWYLKPNAGAAPPLD
jgi:hypothetical protein